MKTKNWKQILTLLKELKSHRKFYRMSINTYCDNPTQENYNIFWADAKVLHNAETKLHILSRE